MYSKKIMPIEQWINGLLRDRDRAEWSGNTQHADRIQQQIDRARERERKGELYEVMF